MTGQALQKQTSQAVLTRSAFILAELTSYEIIPRTDITPADISQLPLFGRLNEKEGHVERMLVVGERV
jgi:hypothetical protein